jgi:REP element-mobilizing transposase RayT
MQAIIPLEPGHYYHIYNRGNNRENIFFEERNYCYFLQLYQKYILPVCDTFAYCLMRNHFHILVRVLEKQTCQVSETWQVLEPRYVSLQFSNLFNSYAKAMNTAYQRTGSLFQKPFNRIEVDSDRYFAQLIHYIHFNPQKHGFVDDFRQYPFSSYQAIVSDKPTNVRKDEVLQWFQGKDYFVQLHDVLCEESVIRHLVTEDFD